MANAIAVSARLSHRNSALRSLDKMMAIPLPNITNASKVKNRFRVVQLDVPISGGRRSTRDTRRWRSYGTRAWCAASGSA